MQTFAQIGVFDTGHAGAGGRLLFLDCNLGGETAFHTRHEPCQPALIVGEHLIGLHDIA